MDSKKRGVVPDRIRGVVWAGVAIGVWSGSLVMLRLGVTTGLNAFDLAALRFGTSALILAPILFTTAGAKVERCPLGILGLIVGFGAPYVVLISVALQTAPASAAGSLNPAVMVVASVIIGRAWFGERITRSTIVGSALLLIGAACVAGIVGGSQLRAGHVVLVGTGAMWAGYVAVVTKMKIAALPAAAVVAVGSAVLYLPVYVVFLPKEVGSAPLSDVLTQAGFQGVLVSVLAVFGFNRSVELLGPTVGSALPALIPPVTLGLGALILDESTTLTEMASATMICLGVGTVLTSRRDAGATQNAHSQETPSKLPRLVKGRLLRSGRGGNDDKQGRWQRVRGIGESR